MPPAVGSGSVPNPNAGGLSTNALGGWRLACDGKPAPAVVGPARATMPPKLVKLLESSAHVPSCRRPPFCNHSVRLSTWHKMDWSLLSGNAKSTCTSSGAVLQACGPGTCTETDLAGSSKEQRWFEQQCNAANCFGVAQRKYQKKFRGCPLAYPHWYNNAETTCSSTVQSISKRTP